MNAPNPVQRRDRKMASDDLIAPCADGGGTFRNPAPKRETDRVTDSAARILLALVVALVMGAATWPRWWT